MSVLKKKSCALLGLTPIFNTPCTWCRRVHRVPGTEVFGPWNFMGSINRMRSMPEASSLVSLNHSAYSMSFAQNSILSCLIANILPSMQKRVFQIQTTKVTSVTLPLFLRGNPPVAPSINRRICKATASVFFVNSRGRDKNSISTFC